MTRRLSNEHSPISTRNIHVAKDGTNTSSFLLDATSEYVSSQQCANPALPPTEIVNQPIPDGLSDAPNAQSVEPSDHGKETDSGKRGCSEFVENVVDEVCTDGFNSVVKPDHHKKASSHSRSSKASPMLEPPKAKADTRFF